MNPSITGDWTPTAVFATNLRYLLDTISETFDYQRRSRLGAPTERELSWLTVEPAESVKAVTIARLRAAAINTTVVPDGDQLVQVVTVTVAEHDAGPLSWLLYEALDATCWTLDGTPWQLPADTVEQTRVVQGNTATITWG